jgi:N utilization substance protein A
MAKRREPAKVEGPSPEEILKKKGREILTVVETMHREKKIPKDVIFNGIEAALQQATERQLGIEPEIRVHLDRETGQMSAHQGDREVNALEMEKIISQMGRIIAQSVKQSMIQKIREAECQTAYDDFHKRIGTMVRGTVQRIDAGSGILTIEQGAVKSEALLPRSEMIPGESHHVHQTVKAVVMDVRKNGNRVKIVLSRCHPDFVRCLFEDAIPEIAERTIEIKAVAREAGYRTKIAVSSIDMKVDAVGACVGVRGSRIKNVIEELGGERIDIVRWNQSIQVMIENALQPASIVEVIMNPLLGRVIVQVPEDQLSLAIGRRGQNVRLASKLVGWDIEIMTVEEHGQAIDKAIGMFSTLPEVTETAVERLIEEGFLDYEDLTLIETDKMADVMGTTLDDAQEIIDFAEDMVARIESGEVVVEPATPNPEAEEAEPAPESAEVTETPAPAADTIEPAREPAPEPEPEPVLPAGDALVVAPPTEVTPTPENANIPTT